jgi:predicted dinucleotide-binding enzyme
MTVIGIIGAGEAGSQLARAAIANGYEVVIANSRGPHRRTRAVRARRDRGRRCRGR